jgi:hypothetical protein
MSLKIPCIPITLPSFITEEASISTWAVDPSFLGIFVSRPAELALTQCSESVVEFGNLRFGQVLLNAFPEKLLGT